MNNFYANNLRRLTQSNSSLVEQTYLRQQAPRRNAPEQSLKQGMIDDIFKLCDVFEDSAEM